MDKIKVIHDSVGLTLTVWFGDPKLESICEETSDEVVLMKDKDGKVIGFELLNYKSSSADPSLLVETIVKTAEAI
jgi:uncharacterized protein YuzE